MREYFDPRAVLGTIGLMSVGFLLLVLSIAISYALDPTGSFVPWSAPSGQEQPGTPVAGSTGGVAAFASPEEYRAYLTSAAESMSGYGGFGVIATRSMAVMDAPAFGLNETKAVDSVQSAPEADLGGSAPDRVSQTNVQVIGIDEPDIVKTDGRNIFFSRSQYYYPMWGVRMMPVDEGFVPPVPRAGVQAIAAFPPADMAVLGSIDASGDLLLIGKVLVVFGQDGITAYDVLDPKAPGKTWEAKYADNHRLVAARLVQDKLYVVTQADASIDRPCPIKPFMVGERSITVPCSHVYHPFGTVPVDSTFSVLTFDPATGSVGATVSFVGSSSASVVAMFQDNMYVSYSYPGDVLGFLISALTSSSDLLPAWLADKLNQLKTYDLSLETKMTEFQQLIERYQRSLSQDDRLKFENEMQNRMSAYAEVHQRELERTGLVKVRISDLSVQATGEVPGQLLNQFSLDEHEGNLRVAVTFGDSWFVGRTGGSASDVYVLGGDMRELGSVKDLGKTERIYSVRFVGNRGYVVTFRQTDPFYVLDLADPKAPRLAGELKIPGFSSYLHPLAPNRVLGVGQEAGQVKLSLFDVTDPANPTEAAKYMLDDYWSEVSQTHHAFLQDAKHGVVFIPGGKGGYVFSYTGDQLKLVSAVSGVSPKRALYLNDYLYLVADDKISVLNENDWTKVKELILDQ